MNPEDFAQFLKLLSHDTEEAGRRYAGMHKKLIGFFILKGVSDPGHAADETIDRAVLKICAGTDVPDVDKYCLGIARNIVKEKLRFLHREKSAFHKFIEDISNSSSEQVERIYSILKPCLEHLVVEDQQLLLEYCQEIQGQPRSEHRRQVAATMKISMLALRVRVARLRNRLTDCVQKRLN